MSINVDKLNKLNDLVTLTSRKKHIVILDPNDKYENIEDENSDMLYDKAQWKIPDDVRTLVEELSANNQLSNEDKILLIYEKLCKEYVYDDNLLSYIQKIDFEH